MANSIKWMDVSILKLIRAIHAAAAKTAVMC